MDPEIDAAHQRLFTLLDDLGVHRRESDLGGLNLLVDQLLEHSLEHFAHEEAVMRVEGYPGGREHAERHQALRSQLIQAVRLAANDELDLPEFINRMRLAFAAHFEQDDLAFVRWQGLRTG